MGDSLSAHLLVCTEDTKTEKVGERDREDCRNHQHISTVVSQETTHQPSSLHPSNL